MTVHQRATARSPSSLIYILALAIVVTMVFYLAKLLLDRPEVYFDEDASGKRVCILVSNEGKMQLCSDFTDAQLSRFDWHPALKHPEQEKKPI